MIYVCICETYFRLRRSFTVLRAALLSTHLIACSIPNEVIAYFNWPNPSSRAMALGSTQRLTEMSIRNILGDKGRPACKADNLTAVYEPICLYNMWEPRRLTIPWASTACYKDTFTFFTFYYSLYVVRHNL
jgi:hypothetical protein